MRVVSPAPRPDWRKIFAADPVALPDKAPEWTDAIVALGQYTDASRLYEFEDGRRFVLPLLRKRGLPPQMAWYESFPHACGIGGLVGDDLDDAVVRAVMDDLHSLGALRVSLRPDPIRGEMWQRAAGPGVTVIPRRAHVLDLSGGVEAVSAGLSKSTRAGIRKAKRRGVTVVRDRDGSLLPVYQELYLSSLERWARRQHEPLALARWRAARRDPARKLYQLAERMGESFRLHVAFYRGMPAAASIAVFGNTVHDTRGAMDREVAAWSRANDLLQWTTISEACAAGCSWYHLGESGESESLAHYKERFGARPADYPELHIERFPLTETDRLVRSGVKQLIGFRDAH